jgi:hypothetical protein
VCLGRAGPLVPPVPLVTGHRVAGHPGYPDPVGQASRMLQQAPDPKPPTTTKQSQSPFEIARDSRVGTGCRCATVATVTPLTPRPPPPPQAPRWHAPRGLVPGVGWVLFFFVFLTAVPVLLGAGLAGLRAAVRGVKL